MDPICGIIRSENRYRKPILSKFILFPSEKESILSRTEVFFVLRVNRINTCSEGRMDGVCVGGGCGQGLGREGAWCAGK